MTHKLARKLLFLLMAAPLFGGGFWLQFQTANANAEAKAKHAVLVVRPAGCHNPERAKVKGTAEGLVDGQRRSIPLTLIPLSEPGTYAVAQTWPDTGNWVLSFSAEADGRQTGAIAAATSGGINNQTAHFTAHVPTSAEIDSSLQAAAKAA